MTLRNLRPDRRAVLAGALAAALPRPAASQPAPARGPVEATRPVLSLRVKPGGIDLRGDGSQAAGWMFETALPSPLLQGSELQLSLDNAITAPLALSWRSGSGAAIEPLAARPPLLPGQTVTAALALRHAGTVLCDARLIGDGQDHALPALGLTVAERDAVAVDRDILMLIEDWRLAQNGGTAAPGTAAAASPALFTINGRPSLDIAVRSHQRLRLRFINGCQRAPIALRLDGHEVRVMAIDGQPAEPFISRDGQLTLAPGSRIDAFVDAVLRPGAVAVLQLHDGQAPRPIARLVYGAEDPVRHAPLPPPDPLPDNNGLPAKLDLTSALRIDLPLDVKPGSAGNEWLRPASLNATAAPAFRIKRGRVGVVAISNPAPEPVTFHLHGHAFRWLDRLDDGWKPFWLDTLLLAGGATQRVAFLADQAGPWLIEAMATRWDAPRLARWYMVE